MTEPFSPTPIARVVAWEAICSLGESAAETALLLRAGVQNVSLSRFIDDKGKRIKLCSAPAIPDDLLGPARLAALAGHAINGLFSKSKSIGGGSSDRAAFLAIALPERFSEQSGPSLNADGALFSEALRPLLPLELKECETEYFPFGRAAGALAIQRCASFADRGYLAICGGVDSQYDWPTLDALAGVDRLLTDDNVDGLRPGEGAAFLALDDVGMNAESGSDIKVFSVGLAREPHPIGSEEQCNGAGLSSALDAAVQPLRAAGLRTNFWLLDNSHEDFATQELQNIITRFGDVLGMETKLQMPLRELGDVGAATMPLLVALGAEAWRRGYASDNVAVATSCSDRGARGALLFGVGS